METRDNAVTREIRKIVRNEQHEVALHVNRTPKSFGMVWYGIVGFNVPLDTIIGHFGDDFTGQ